MAALSVPAATLDAVGSPSGDVLPTKIGNGTVLKGADGKPLITYIGAEYCPFCAAERWALAVALSRFGTFSNLSGTHSSGSDEFPDTQTLSFYGSSYSSPYIDFEPVEEATNQPAGAGYQTLQAPTAAESALVAKYDSAGEHPVPRYRQSLPHHGFELLAAGAAGAVTQPDRGRSVQPGQRSGAGHRRDGERDHRRHRHGHGEPALQCLELVDHCGDRPEAGGVTVARTVVRRVPGWVSVASFSLSLAAVAIASYLTVTHYTDPAALACPDTGIVNCTLVTTSSWSVLVGVPLAVLGVVWAVVMTALTTPWAWRSAARWVDGARLAVSGAGAAMVLYLVYVELYRIGAICLWCTAMHVSAVCLFGVILGGRAASSHRVPAAT